MQVALRRGYGWGGLGQSGETDVEGGGFFTGAPDFSSGEVDPSTFFPAPGYNIGTTPGVELSPAELAAEQTRARAWLSSLDLPSGLTTGAKVALTAAQIAAGVQTGNLKPSSTCPGGYLVAGTGQCVGSPGTAGAPLIAGISNQTLAIGVGVLFLFMMMGSGGRRR